MNGASFSQTREDHLHAAEHDQRKQHGDERFRPPTQGVPRCWWLSPRSWPRTAPPRLCRRTRRAANKANSTSAPSFAHQGVPPSLRLKPRSHAYIAPPSMLPLCVLHAVLHRNERLGVLRGYAEDARRPHPEHRARAAGQNRGADAHDVASADGRGKRGAKRRPRS